MGSRAQPPAHRRSCLPEATRALRWLRCLLPRCLNWAVAASQCGCLRHCWCENQQLLLHSLSLVLVGVGARLLQLLQSAAGARSACPPRAEDAWLPRLKREWGATNRTDSTEDGRKAHTRGRKPPKHAAHDLHLRKRAVHTDTSCLPPTCGQAAEHAQVAGQAAAARVQHTKPVHQQQLRRQQKGRAPGGGITRQDGSG